MPAMTRRRRCGAPGARCVARQRRGQLGRQRGIAKYHLLDHASPGRALRRACLLLQPVTDLQSHCSPHLIKTTNEPPHDERRQASRHGRLAPTDDRGYYASARCDGITSDGSGAGDAGGAPAVPDTAGVSRRHSIRDPFVARALTLLEPRGRRGAAPRQRRGAADAGVRRAGGHTALPRNVHEGNHRCGPATGCARSQGPCLRPRFRS